MIVARLANAAAFFTGAALVSAALVSTGCEAPESPRADGAADTAALETSDRRFRVPSPRERAEPPLDPRTWLAPSWPDSWTVTASGAVGPESLPVVWYRLDAGGTPPREAVERALEIVAPEAGEILLDDLTEDPATGSVVGQLRGRRLAASITASEVDGGTRVRLSAEVQPPPP